MKGKWGVYMLGLIVGGLLGFLLPAGWDKTHRERASVDESKSATRLSFGVPEPDPESYTSILVNEMQGMESSLRFSEASKRLKESRLSPIRSKAFLKSRMHTMTKDEAFKALEDGEITGMDDLRAMAWRLAEDHAEETFRRAKIQRLVDYGNIDGYYAFDTAFIHAWLHYHDGADYMKILSSMKPGGGRQDSAYRFTDSWAWKDPRATAENFDQLVELRSIMGGRSLAERQQRYAYNILRSWRHSNAEEMLQYIEGLPSGAHKTAFEAALQRLEKDIRLSDARAGQEVK